jgi:peptidoglycan L-alanyl-D-glutamate endopeptidase CwlK
LRWRDLQRLLGSSISSLMDAISQRRLALVHPELARRVTSLIDQLETEGYDVRVTRGISTVAEQDALYAQGRTEPGPIVTNAKGTQSNHVLGFASDLAIMDENGEPQWESPGFDRIVDLAASHGLRSGAEWGDRPHVELQDVPAIPTEESQQTYLEHGVQALWAQTPISSLTTYL